MILIIDSGSNMNIQCSSIILAILVIFFSIGCYSHSRIPKNQIDDISEGDKIVVTDMKMRSYKMTVENVTDKEIIGFEDTEEEKTRIIIFTDQISSVTIRQMDFGMMILAGATITVAIIYDGIILPLH
jgi:hypothetical protein